MPPKKTPDGEYIITREAVQEMLQVQERMFKDFISTTSYNLTKRVDDLVKDVAEIRASLQYSQREIDTIKVNIAEYTEDLKVIGSEIN